MSKGVRNVSEMTQDELREMTRDELAVMLHETLLKVGECGEAVELAKNELAIKERDKEVSKYASENQRLRDEYDKVVGVVNGMNEVLQDVLGIQYAGARSQKDLEKMCRAFIAREALPPEEPISVAAWLINMKNERETTGFERAVLSMGERKRSERYSVAELRQIAEHLLVYCGKGAEKDE